MNDKTTLPLDARLMNGMASLLFVALGVMLLVAALAWLLRHPVFALGGVVVVGDVTHNNAVTLRANVAPHLRGGFFTVDLAQTRSAFESAPWVRRAIVKREFPNRLRVVLQEHRALAYWGAEGESRLVNSYGEVFEANLGDVEQEDLPRLQGPDIRTAPQLLAMYQALQGQLASLDLAVAQLVLTARGSWQVQLATNATLELGRGTPEELMPRVQRFVQTLTQVASRYGRGSAALEGADLRYQGGYALRLSGVSTVLGNVQPGAEQR
jgi:cell division protein FtsQ